MKRTELLSSSARNGAGNSILRSRMASHTSAASSHDISKFMCTFVSIQTQQTQDLADTKCQQWV